MSEIYTECVVCGQSLYFGEEAYKLHDGEEEYIGLDYCMEEYALEHLDEDIELDDEYTALDYARDFLASLTHTPTKREYDLRIADIKADEELLRRKEEEAIRRSIEKVSA
jgi:hypothetical protein